MKSDLTAWQCRLVPLCLSLHISFALLAGCTRRLLLLKWHQIKSSLTLVPSVLLQPLHALTAFDTLNPKADAPDTYCQNTLSTDPNPKHAIQLHIHHLFHPRHRRLFTIQVPLLLMSWRLLLFHPCHCHLFTIQVPLLLVLCHLLLLHVMDSMPTLTLTLSILTITCLPLHEFFILPLMVGPSLFYIYIDINFSIFRGDLRRKWE